MGRVITDSLLIKNCALSVMNFVITQNVNVKKGL